MINKFSYPFSQDDQQIQLYIYTLHGVSVLRLSFTWHMLNHTSVKFWQLLTTAIHE